MSSITPKHGPVNQPGAARIPNEALCFASGSLSNYNPAISPSFLARAISAQMEKEHVQGADGRRSASRLLTLAEAAKQLQLCSKSVSRLCKRGILKPVRLSRRVVRIPEAQLIALGEGGAR
jgi:hypothetical protein